MPKIQSKYIVAGKVNEDFEVKILSESSNVLKKFFKNFQYLAGMRGLSAVKVQSDLRDQYGFRVDRCAVGYFVRGKYEKANTKYLAVYAVYLGEPLIKLLSVDYEAEAKSKELTGT